eukprot:12234544-Karenia_brevis.AAC.1
MKLSGPRRYPCPQWPDVPCFPQWQIPLFMVELPSKGQVRYDPNFPDRHTKGSLCDQLHVQAGFDDRQDICAEAGEWGVV